MSFWHLLCKPMYLKDYHRRNLLAGGEGSDDEAELNPVVTYEEEQKALKEAFHITTAGEDEEEDDLIKPKLKSKDMKIAEEREYQNFLEETLKDESSRKFLDHLQSLASKPSDGIESEDGEAFLAKYFLNREWLDPQTATPELYEDLSSDDERAEEFETKYNFRFEQPGGTDITTHSRTLPSTRRGDEKRKRERERKILKKEEEKRKEMEEIARLRNLKRMELEERLKRLEEVAGAKGWTETDIEADFDPEEWDKRMQGVFDDTYYNEVFLSISHRIN